MTRSNLPRQQLVNRALARKWNEQTTTGEREREGGRGRDGTALPRSPSSPPMHPMGQTNGRVDGCCHRESGRPRGNFATHVTWHLINFQTRLHGTGERVRVNQEISQLQRPSTLRRSWSQVKWSTFLVTGRREWAEELNVRFGRRGMHIDG